MASGEYPSRETCFAHRFVRLLQKSCAAMDIGQSACLLLCYIAHTEDAARYSGPVRFWNEQLMAVMGFRSPKQLNDARSKAEAAGWLVYERSGNREVGRYWVTVPAEFEGLSDTVIEDNRSVNHSEIGTISGTNPGMNSERIPERISEGSRNENVTESGKPSNPIPNPIPLKHRDAVASSVPEVVLVNATDAAAVNAPTRRKPPFVKPTVCEISDYVGEINATVDAKQFWDYYESNGWRVGRNPMKDWRATVRQWHGRNLNGSLYGNERTTGNSAAAREHRNASAFEQLQRARERAGVSVPASGDNVGSVRANLTHAPLFDETDR